MFHRSVLTSEALRYLDLRPNKNYVDANLGTGGHALRILEGNGPEGILVGFEWDTKACQVAKERLQAFGGRFRLIQENFTGIEQALGEVSGFDGVLYDLGVSSLQLEDGERGFSFLKEGPLDMRMDSRNSLRASDIVNGFREEEISSILKEFGEERFAKRIARAIISRRKRSRIDSTTDLAGLISACVPKRFHKPGIHPATKSFMALRIFVNDEIENLKKSLESAPKVIKRGGRLVIISFHSLEDRVAKEFLKSEQKGCICPRGIPMCACGRKPSLKVLTPKPVTPGEEEISRNPNSRSAKLRAAQRL